LIRRSGDKKGYRFLEKISESGNPLGGVLFVISIILAELLFEIFFLVRGDVVVENENAKKNAQRNQ